MSETSVVGQIALELGLESADFKKRLMSVCSREGNAAAQSLTSTFTKAFSQIGTVMTAAFSVGKIVEFGKKCIESAAGVNAANSQLEQTFGSLQDKAESAMKAVAKESGIVETRLQGVGTSIYAFAKTSGMDSATALSMMQEALQVTADSAAYYDRSLEDTAESLKSFLKGNYANDAALGISCTETTRNAAANKLYGKSFQSLSEAQKQLALLQMVKDANKLSGALGQAARESDGWENVTGNLTESFKQLFAVIGQPILAVTTKAVKALTAAIQKLTVYAKTAVKAISDMFGLQMNDSADSIAAISDNADSASEAVDNTTDSVKKLKKATAGFDQLNILSSDKSDDTSTDTVQTETALSVPIDTSAAENSIDTIDNSIESLKKKLQSLGELPVFKTISDIFKNIFTHVKNIADSLISWATEIDLTPLINGFNSILEPIENIVNNCLEGLELFVTDFVEPTASWAIEEAVPKAFETIADALKLSNKFGEETYDTLSLLKEEILDPIAQWSSDLIVSAIDAIRNAINTTGEKLLNLWEAVKPFVDWLIKVLKPAVMGVLAFIQGLLEGLWEMIKGIVDGIIDVLTGIIKFITGVFENDWTKAWEGIKQIFAGLFEALWGIVEGACKIIAGIIKGLLDILLSAVKIIWDSIAYACQCIWNVIKGIINLIIDGINLLWQGIYGVVKGIVDSVGGIAGALGDLFGQDWHFNMPQQPPLIPKLAKGGLATSPTLALVGDNKNAKSDPEVIAPLSKLKQMIVPPTIKALSGNGNYNSESSIKEKSSNNSEIIMMLNKMYELIRNQEEQYINNIYLDSEKIESKSVKIRKRKARRYNNV